MRALINNTNQAGSYLQKEIKENELKNVLQSKLIDLLKQKIEESIIEDKRFVAIVSTPLITCRNTFTVEDFEIDERCLYLNHENFELHINLDEIEIKCEVLDRDFKLTYKDMNIVLHLLE